MKALILALALISTSVFADPIDVTIDMRVLNKAAKLCIAYDNYNSRACEEFRMSLDHITKGSMSIYIEAHLQENDINKSNIKLVKETMDLAITASSVKPK